MELTQALAGRRSERHFSDEPVPAEVISALIGVASHAPSAGNRQPWRVAAVAPAAARAIIDDLEPKAWEILYPTLREVIASDPTVLGRAPSARELAAEVVAFVRANIFLQGAPWLLVTWFERAGAKRRGEVIAATAELLRHRVAAQPSLSDKARLAAFVASRAPVAIRTDYQADVASVAGFAYGLTLAAHARGLATCIQYTWALVGDELRARLSLPRRAEVLGAVVVGHPLAGRDQDLQARVSPRKPVAVTWFDDDGGRRDGAVAPG